MRMKFCTFSLEKSLLDRGYARVAGIDEVGRGCLAGPVVAAAVLVSSETQYLSGVWDSKQMTRSSREAVFNQLCGLVEAYGVGVASVAEIDELGIAEAAARAMLRAYSALSVRPDIVLVDGPPSIASPNLSKLQIVDGDRKHYVISAASVIAKVHRDRLMVSMARDYPRYGFERHVGYGTREHLEALKQYGACEIHRTSYAPVRRVMKRI